MVPDWLQILALVSLLVGCVCAGIIARDVRRDPQHMWIMNVVWPVVALFGLFAAVWAYFRYGKLAASSRVMPAMERGEEMPNKRLTPFPMMVAKGTLHCGAGCTLGDIISHWLAFLAPAVAVWAGWKSIFETKIYADWVLAYVFAFVLGVAFQYFTIVPMRGLSPARGLVEAVKADTLSLTAWQVGMYGWMAVAHFWIFATVIGTDLEVNSLEFWFMMQVAMIFGFLTSYPVNWWLVRRGIKEKM